MLVALLRAGMLAVDLAKARAKATVRDIVRGMAFGAATILFLLLAFSFGLAAFTVWLAHEIGTVAALGFIGLGFLVIAGIVVAVASSGNGSGDGKRSRPIAPAVKQEFSETRSEPAPTGSTLGAMGAVGLVAFLFARQLFRRR